MKAPPHKDDLLTAHWTNKGLFEIYWNTLAGSIVCELYLDKRYIETGTFINLLVQDLIEGKFEDKVGFSVTGLGIPLDGDTWNQKKRKDVGMFNANKDPYRNWP